MRRKSGITLKLLIWCLALVAVFCLTTAQLLNDVNGVVAESGEIVRTNYEIGVAVQRMLDLLGKLEEDRKRYEILQDDTYMEAVVQDLADLGALLDTTLAAHPEYAPLFEPLTREYTITLKKGANPERLLMPDATVGFWTVRLEEIRASNRQAMESRLEKLYATASDSSRQGMLGVAAVVGLGLTGSLLFAWSLNRNLRRIRRGIRRFARTGKATSVGVTSRDELGELATAFDRLTSRLEREERMRADFISMLSHEIRTPLTSIRESVDLVAEGAFGEVQADQKRFLDIAGNEAVRLTDLLERLMRVSRLEAGRMDIAPLAENPVLLADSALERVRPVAEVRGISLQLESSEGLPAVLADAGQVTQVLMNLLGNAVKFSPPQAKVELEVGMVPGAVSFCVLDRGPGVPEEERELIFQKWFRGECGNVDGAGLGLYISRSIVEAHGGEMQCQQREGGGACFCFTLPAA